MVRAVFARFATHNASSAEFRKQLLSEFRTLKQQSGDASNAISKQRLKQLYLQLLKSGPNIMSDRTMADQFLAKLDSQEITALMDILRMDPEETMKYVTKKKCSSCYPSLFLLVHSFFNKDPEVVDAIKNKVPLFPASASGQNKWDLSEQDLLGMLRGRSKRRLLLLLLTCYCNHLLLFPDSDDEEDDTSPMSDAVQEAIKVFEENLASYTRNPAAILSLCDKLNDKDQQQFLNYIFKNYTPDKIENKLKQKQQKQESKQPQAPPIPQEVLDHNLVSHVFKEVFTHFRAYKKQPHKFKPLIDRLNPGEQKAFDALVKAFWDLSVDKLKL